MKTSNKILLGLVSVLVLLPVLMLVGFKNKIANKDFTVETFWWMSNSKKDYALQPARFIKLQTPDSIDLKCQLFYGASDHYKLNGYDDNDSLAVVQIADTLVFRLIPGPFDANNNERSELSFNLYMPAYHRILADGAQLSIDSLNLSDTLHIALVNKGKLMLGNGEDEEAPMLNYGNIELTAENSQVELLPKLNMQSLKVKLEGNSALDIDKQAKIRAISGTVSPGSMVNGPASYMYQLLFDSN